MSHLHGVFCRIFGCDRSESEEHPVTSDSILNRFSESKIGTMCKITFRNKIFYLEKISEENFKQAKENKIK